VLQSPQNSASWQHLLQHQVESSVHLRTLFAGRSPQCGSWSGAHHTSSLVTVSEGCYIEHGLCRNLHDSCTGHCTLLRFLCLATLQYCVSSVRLPVCLSVCPIGILTMTQQWTACDAASFHFDPTIRRVDILVLNKTLQWLTANFCVYFYFFLPGNVCVCVLLATTLARYCEIVVRTIIKVYVKGKIWPPLPQNPLTYRHQNLYRWLGCRNLSCCKMLSRSD